MNLITITLWILNSILILIGIGVLLLLGIQIGLGMGNSAELGHYNKDCRNLSLQETSACLVNKVRPHYYYNISNLNNILNESQLFTQGGVCWHYAVWYVNASLERGYNATTVDFTWGDVGHEIAIVSDNKTYCIIDQLREYCF